MASITPSHFKLSTRASNAGSDCQNFADTTLVDSQNPKLLQEVLDGLTAVQPTLPCKLFYDERGSDLFDRICELPEYYPTRTERQIMQDHIQNICHHLGPDVTLIELGSGSSPKTPLLLDHMQNLQAYIPIDICHEHVFATATRLAGRYPNLPIIPIHADYTCPLKLPEDLPGSRRRIIYFPGSTIGNFDPPAARQFLARLAQLAGPNGAVLLGADLRKDTRILLPAYNDAAQVTAAFNRNVLYRLKKTFNAQLDPHGFTHEARWNDKHSRIEMHLVACSPQTIQLAGRTIHLNQGQSIWTESSYKHDLAGWAGLAQGLKQSKVWTDQNQWFSIQYLTHKDQSTHTN